MTAREFAAAIDRPYPTVALWLRQKRVPGAYQESVGDFSVWQIPAEAIDEFKPPALGRPPKPVTDEQAAASPAIEADAKPAKKAGKASKKSSAQ